MALAKWLASSHAEASHLGGGHLDGRAIKDSQDVYQAYLYRHPHDWRRSRDSNCVVALLMGLARKYGLT